MKRIHFIASILICLLLTACSKEEIPVWTELGRVWFTVDSKDQLSALNRAFTFAAIPEEETQEENGLRTYTIELPLSLAGKVEDYDREVNLVVTQEPTHPDTRYEVIRPVIIPANATKGIAKIKIFNTENLSEEQDFLKFSIQNSEELVCGLTYALELNLSIYAKYVKPDWWDYGAYFKSAWGEFTTEKMKVLVSATGSDKNPYPNNDMAIYRYNCYLINTYIDEHQPTEADGTPMKKINI